MMGFIYVLRSEGFLKIGWSRNPEARLRTAKTFNPRPVDLVGFFDAEDRQEREVHIKFSAYRLNGSEWFKDEGEVAAWAATLSVGGNDILTDWIKAHRGSQVRLAKHLNVTRSNISQWRKVPVEHLVRVEAFTGIPRHQLRPDIFRDPLKSTAEAAA